ncbi:non-structural maintenance of chromosomes element 1 homolog [Tetranychus urticae]|uniref:Non-structural maintenance of chromosomes element 1 homolog n=1 Tax=Tetranychus urticae TaxID=32264 RepID=T1KC77_TETUR|nr:non-structural maintenance of chromosomes element 1 homolog [Tetranychus urticae]
MSVKLKDKEKAFLQLMMRSKSLVKDQALNLCLKMELASNDKELDSLIRKVNKQIKEFRFEIRKFIDEESGNVHFVFINLIDNHISRLSTLYTKAQLEYFKKVISAIVLSPCGYVDYNKALNLTSQLVDHNVKLRVSEADEMLKHWNQEKYLATKKDQFNICLGIRSLTELDVYLKDHFPNNVTSCDMCKSICIQGTNCPHLGVKLHAHCADKYFKNFKNCTICNC